MRDLYADLELCSKATKGSWAVNSHPAGWIDIINPLEDTNKRIATVVEMGDAEFVAAARTGWPEAIERAIKAEEELAKAFEMMMVMNADGCELYQQNTVLSEENDLQRHSIQQLSAQVVQLREGLKTIRDNPELWKRPKIGGQDKYAGMPPLVRKIDSILSQPNPGADLLAKMYREGVRDLQADLELCSKATPGPWKYRSGEWDCDRECGHKAPCFKEMWECEHIKQIHPADVFGPFTINYDDYCGLSDDNAKFIAAAREGWPEAIERALAAEETMAMWKGICENSPTQELDEKWYREKVAALREENEKLKNELGSVKYIRDKYQGELVAKEILDDEFENGELVKLLAVVEAAKEFDRQIMRDRYTSQGLKRLWEKDVRQALVDLEGGKS